MGNNVTTINTNKILARKIRFILVFYPPCQICPCTIMGDLESGQWWEATTIKRNTPNASTPKVVKFYPKSYWDSLLLELRRQKQPHYLIKYPQFSSLDELTLKNTPNILKLHPWAVIDDLNAGQWREAIEFQNTPNSQFGPFTELQMRKLAAAAAAGRRCRSILQHEHGIFC